MLEDPKVLIVYLVLIKLPTSGKCNSASPILVRASANSKEGGIKMNDSVWEVGFSQEAAITLGNHPTSQ